MSLLEDQLIELEETIASLVDEDEEKRAELEAARKAREAANEAYFASLAEEKELAAKLSTLKAIQEKAEASDQLSQYEERKGIAGLARLSEALVMPEAWVGAIEALLRHRANAVELRFLETTLSFEEDRPPSPMSFIDAATIARPAGTAPDSLTLSTQGLETPETLTIGESSFTSLLSVMSFKSDAAKRIVPLWLAGVYGVESLKAAMRVRASLPVGVTLVTPVGDRVTRHSVEFWASSDPSEGILSRKLEIERLENALLDLADTLDSKNKERLEGAERVEELESDCQTLSSTLKAEQVNQQALTLKVEKFRSALEAYERREADRQKSRQELLEETEIVNETLEVAIERLDALELERGGIERDVDAAKKALHQAEQAAKLAREAQAKANHLAQMKTLEFKQASENQRLFTGRLSALKEDIAREQHRQDGAKAKLTELEGKHDDAELEKALATFKSAEEAANQANQVLLEKEALLETAQNNWHSWQSSLLPLTESIGQKRGDVQVKMGLKSQFDERLTDLGADRIALRMKVETDHPKITTVRNRVQTLINDITALGPINHAALEHLGAAKRAIEETQHQIADLFGAIDTLENAIRKIDQETRDRMKETFDQVNAYFAETFTDLFGGGSAALTMVGEDILQAGVEIRAQPPGKRNNSVRLLSGGEQALTATALVFGLFKLNPAPFCLLDEVDAPLDEANQACLAQMCTRLSSETQFLIITHHRVTMEYARALIGVTMKEPGVSRIVSVAVEDAVNMVNNG